MYPLFSISTPLAGNIRVVTSRVDVHQAPVQVDSTAAIDKDVQEPEKESKKEEEVWQQDRTGKRRSYNARRKSLANDDSSIEVIEKDIPVKSPKRKRSKPNKSPSKWNIMKVFGFQASEDTIESKDDLEESTEEDHDDKGENLANENGEMEVDIASEATDDGSLEEVLEEKKLEPAKNDSPESIDTSVESDEDEANGCEKSSDSLSIQKSPESGEPKEEDKATSTPVEISIQTQQNGSNPNSVLSISDDPAEIEHHFELHTIGASNMDGLIMKGDDQLKITHHNHFEGGLKIRKAHEKLEDIHDGVKQNLPIIVSNVGACDLSEFGDNNLDEIEERYMSYLDKIREECPKAQIVISGLLPRNGDQYVKVNNDTQLLNGRLRERCIPTDGFIFCDNYQFVLDEFLKVKSDLYTDGIHLKSFGQELLSASIFRVVKYLYFKSIVGDLPESLKFTPEEEASMYKPQQ